MNNAESAVFLPYTLTLRAPAIVTALSGDPDSSSTQPFIPGAAIRGAVAARLLAKGEHADGRVFRDLILAGTVRYLHAYPEVAGERSMPAPRSLIRDDGDPTRARDPAAGSDTTRADDATDSPASSAKAIPVCHDAPFGAFSEDVWKLTTPRIGSRLHQQRDREVGRPWTQERAGQEIRHGMIFSTEYLEPEQIFRGLIQIGPARPAGGSGSGPSPDGYVALVRKLLDGSTILIGRSRRAGYGGVAEVRFDGTPRSSEYGPVSSRFDANLRRGQLLRMVLVSAYIGRDQTTGQIHPAALEAEIRQRGLMAKVEQRWWSFEIVGGFNRKWRLELPQATAACGGCIFVLRVEEETQLTVLESIEQDGLGERRVDGFGRVLFLPHGSQPKPAIIMLDRESGRATPAAGTANQQLSDASVKEHIGFLEQRVVLGAARRELSRIAATLAADAAHLPTPSLLSRLRMLFRPVRDVPTARTALARLHAWCTGDGDENKFRKQAIEKLITCKIRNLQEHQVRNPQKGGDPLPPERRDIPLREWLEAIASPDGRHESSDGDRYAWNRLVERTGSDRGLTEIAARSHLTSVQRAEGVLHQHAAELTVLLVDELLAMMIRQAKKGTKDEPGERARLASATERSAARSPDPGAMGREGRTSARNSRAPRR